ncbi:MAG: hypothetical protein ACOYNU_15565, partial [Bacteroidales bacterium]
MIFIILHGFIAQMTIGQDVTDPSRKVDYSEWNVSAYQGANSAQNEDYLTDEEKKVYYYLNLMRMNPKLFADTYLGYLKNSTDYYESTLYEELQRIKPRPVLKPNRRLFE